MNFKEIQELIRLVGKSGVSVFKIKDGEFEMTIKTSQEERIVHTVPIASPVPQVIHAPVAHAASRPAESSSPVAKEGSPADDKKYLEIKSPMVGTFYRSPGPDKAPFIKVGDQVDAGTTVCIIEAMKLFNEIESEVKGTIVKIVVEDATPVEYDQVLFLVEP
ncbi:MAG: acetyl-CoA carboxylase biotin carboxyl carrier protein [Saprospiraceae bacterium]|nr:acetyl-CoA carboxylase biotin carboxyl carrier protein [Saprospiraceae bacterium]